MAWNFDQPVDREGTDCVKYDLRKDYFGRSDVIPMWVADMDFKTPDFIISAIQQRLSHEILGYSFRPSEYFSSIIRWVNSRHSWELGKEWICFTPGIVPALNFCTLAFTKPGDRIIVQPPVYFPFFSAVEAHGRKLVYNRLIESDGRWVMDYESLESELREGAAMLLLSNPHNPVGRVWTPVELQKLSELCLKYGTLMISDEIHCDLVLPGFRHTPLATLSEPTAASTVTLIAPSKTFNLAGLSTSSVIISDTELRKKFLKLTDSLHVGNGNIFGTVASIAAYSQGHEWLDALLAYLNSNTDIAETYFREQIPEIIPIRPQATYMIWLDCRRLGMNGKELQKFFTGKAAVGMNEGSTFGPGGEGFMRMNVAMPENLLKKALQQIGEAVTQLR
jgi:cysteine-S-conjugate beta-lyase